MLAEAFPDENGWPTIELGLAEIEWVAKDGFVLAAIEGEQVRGWVGGLEEYRGRVWELHPIVVAKDRRLQGTGRVLVEAFEAEARRRGGLTATLGTDDHYGQTSVFDVNLYRDLPAHISGLRDLASATRFSSTVSWDTL